MRNRAEIQAKLDTIVADERYHYPCATVYENAPLALIQLDLGATAQTLAWVLGVKAPPMYQRHKKRRKT